MTAASFLRLLEPVSVFSSKMMQSPASKSLNGNGLDLFSKIVLNRPGNKVVLPVWNSFVFAFSMVISFDSSVFNTLVVKSAFEQRAKLRT